MTDTIAASEDIRIVSGCLNRWKNAIVARVESLDLSYPVLTVQLSMSVEVGVERTILC